MAIHFAAEGRVEDIAMLESVMAGNFDIQFGGHGGTWAVAEQQFSDDDYEKALDMYAQAVATGLVSDLRLVLGHGDSVLIMESRGIF